MRRELRLVGCLALLLVTAAALAGCTLLSTSPPPKPPKVTAGTPLALVSPVPPTASPTNTPVAVDLPSPVPPTATLAPSATPTDVPPTDTPLPTATSTVPPTATPRPPKPTATKQPTSTPRPTARPTATSGGPTSGTGKVVGLDPGHHHLDIGAVSPDGTIKEYLLNMEVALAVRQILIAHGYTVRMSHTDYNPVSCWCAPTYLEKVQAEQAARIAAVGKVDAYVPIHFNGSQSHTVTGTTSYYNLASPVAAQDVALARDLDSSVVSSIRSAGYPAVNRGAESDLTAGKSYGHMYMLRGPYPSALIESLFLDNVSDAAAIAKPSIRAAIERGIANGIMAYLR